MTAPDPEAISPRYRGFDAWSDRDILEALWEGQARAVAAVRAALPAIADAAAAIATRLEGGDGRLIYAGAGSSGQQAALDASELHATFGWPPARTLYLRAEICPPGTTGAGEDDAGRGRAIVVEAGIGAADALVAVAASGTTPYTVALAAAARRSGTLVVGIANRRGSPLLADASVPIFLETGAEAVAGSTRMNAGTAQKAALGLLSTLVMTRLGRIHDGLMVELPSDRGKFARRAVAIVAAIAGCDEAAARVALDAAGNRIKPAVLVALGADPATAARLLADAGDNLRRALALRPAPGG